MPSYINSAQGLKGCSGSGCWTPAQCKLGKVSFGKWAVNDCSPASTGFAPRPW
ncbi:UNVERIFIED_CONTAM: hypothetical protein FKN15_003855 [Acipenser sinensis]